MQRSGRCGDLGAHGGEVGVQSPHGDRGCTTIGERTCVVGWFGSVIKRAQSLVRACVLWAGVELVLPLRGLECEGYSERVILSMVSVQINVHMMY